VWWQLPTQHKYVDAAPFAALVVTNACPINLVKRIK
jgi:hypothetical protein